MDGGAQFEKMEGHGEKGISRRPRAARGASVERNEPVLGGEDEGDDAADASRDFEKGGEEAVDDVMGAIGDLSKVGRSVFAWIFCLDVLVEEGEDQRG